MAGRTAIGRAIATVLLLVFGLFCVSGTARAQDCTSPDGNIGQVKYNTAHHVLQGCTPDGWTALHRKPYVPNAVHFDGTTYLIKSGGLGYDKQFTVSLWLRKTQLGVSRSMMETSVNKLIFLSDTSDNIHLSIDGETLSGALTLRSPANILSDKEWHHILISADVNGANTDNVHLYVDGADIGVTVTSIKNDNLAFTNNWEVGDNVAPSWPGDMAELWLDIGTYIDLSVEANRRNFIDEDGRPVDLGADGSRPTGSPPDIFLSGHTDSWHTNKGTGGGFTENGELTTAATTPALDFGPLDGLVGWWRLDETSGTVAADSVGSTDGSMENGLTGADSAPGILGPSLELDRDEDHGIDTNYGNILQYATDVSVCGWIRPEGSQISTQAIISDYVNGAASGWLMFVAKSSYYSGSKNTISFVPHVSGSTGRVEGPDDLVAVNEWGHFCGVFSGGNYIRLYKNGVLAAENSTNVIDDFDANGGVTVNIGRWRNNSSLNFDGQLADIRVYDRILDAAEIQRIHAYGKPCKSPEGKRGEIIYNTDENLFQSCAPHGWQALHQPVSGGAGCTNPARDPGTLIYNTVFDSYQGCTPGGWAAFHGYNPDPCAGSPTPGMECADGTVYAGLSPDGNEPMYATPADAPGTYTWNNGSGSLIDTALADCTDGTPGTASSCRTGEANTTLLVGLSDAASPYEAAEYCAALNGALGHGHDDWYLPAQDELDVIYDNHVAIGGFDTSGDWYWSSSEYNTNAGRNQRFREGDQGNSTKDKDMLVRCVRRD